jgi:hypothetical protein
MLEEIYLGISLGRLLLAFAAGTMGWLAVGRARDWFRANSAGSEL